MTRHEIRAGLTRAYRRMTTTPLWTMITTTSRRSRVTGCVVGSLVVAALSFALWPEPESEPDPRAREYLEFTACALTDARGLGGPEAAAVWSGMQDASLVTHAKVQYLPVIDKNGEINAELYLAGLLERRCEVVIGVGDAQADAIRRVANLHPKVRFAVVVGGGSTSDPSPNVTVVASALSSSSNPRVATIPWSDSEAVSTRVAKVVRDAVGRRD